jgi:GT2 family glycosyltransferase
LIHLLNQRYRREWERAKQLQGELARLRAGPLGPALAWLRRVKRWLRPPAPEPPLAERAVPCPELGEAAGPVCGRVSLIVPFKDRLELLRNCLGSLRLGSYRDFEVVLVDNGSGERRTRRFLRRLEGRRGARVVDCPGPFNFSRLCNEGARRASGDYVLFLNNDTEVLAPDWLEQLLVVARHPQVGAAGATLLYPDRTIQHVGIFPRADGSWVHPYRGRPEDEPGDRGELGQVRAVPAVTAACLLMRRPRFLALGGFDERLPLTFGDVDLCCRLRERGLLVVVTPHARLWHFESLSRGYAVDSPGSGHLAALARLPSAGDEARRAEAVS